MRKSSKNQRAHLWQRSVALGSVLTITASMAGCTGLKPAPNTPPANADSTAAEKPNIVYIVLDDVGFGDLGCYGSSMKTPNMDAMANQGILYANYCTSPMSSPSRSSMLTGCESNLLGMGTVADMDLGENVPNLHGRIYPEHGMVTHALKESGYSTMAVGKWHMAPYEEFAPDGDKAFWPAAQGFDKNYNYVGSQTNQFEPGGLFEGNAYVLADTSDPNYHLTNALVDKSLEYIDQTGENPFFTYLAVGAMHGPFNVAQKYIDQYKGQFDHGWDVEREKIFAKQKELGLFAADVELPARDPNVAAWDSMSDKEKALSAKHMEVYAGFMEHTDEQLGRFMDELKKRDKFDNTIFMLVSDNGANSNGGTFGSLTAHANENIFAHDVDTQYAHMDEFGTAEYGTQYNKGWAMTSNTPFRNYKTQAHFGGIRTTFLASWKNGIKDPGRICNDLVAVSDITPTIYDVVGMEQPKEIGGVAQHTMQGVSFKDTFASSAPRKEPHPPMALMMFMDRTYIEGDYSIVTNPKTGAWELYDVKKDPTQVHNLAETMPDKLAEMTKTYETVRREDQGAQNFMMDLAQGVTPDVMIQRYGDVAKDFFNVMQNKAAPTLPETVEYLRIMQMVAFNPGGTGYAGVGVGWYRSPDSKQSKKDYTYKPEEGYFFSLAGAQTVARSHSIKTTVEADDKAQGVIMANGGIDGGYAIYVKDGRLTYEYNYAGERQKIVSSKPFPAGKTDVEVEYQKATVTSGTAILKMNGEVVAQGEIKLLPIFTSYDYYSFGEDVGSRVSLDYTDSFKFTGKVGDVNIHLGDDVLKS